MPALLGFWGALGADVAIWVVWSVAVGWRAARWSDASVNRDGPVTRLRGWERGGLAYARIGIRRWKGRLPDFGPAFGGRRKELDSKRDPASWRQMAGETRRAERVHWLILLALPAEALVRAGMVLVPMTAFAAIANLPCIAVQRHNRGRLHALAEHRRGRGAGRRSVPAVPPA
jgi:glycosyl-4,4'-diaponeurosporenoate acyltransferase